MRATLAALAWSSSLFVVEGSAEALDITEEGHLDLQLLRLPAFSAMSVLIVLFRNDLRLHDNEVLQRAVSSAADHVLPLYCFDPRHFAKTHWFGFPRVSPLRYRFLTQSVSDLQKNLRNRGSGLLVRVGAPEEVVPALAKQLGGSATVKGVHLHEEICSEERGVERSLASELKGLGIPITKCWGSTLVHRDDLPFPPTQLPDVYTQFRKRVESSCDICPVVELPQQLKPLPPAIAAEEAASAVPPASQFGISEAPVDQRGVLPFQGGETAALSRLDEYFFKADCLKDYKQTRNGLVGANYSSKFSPWLALGCLSPRHVYHKVKEYERQRVANDSTYWLIFELLWRDYFKFIGVKFGTKLFQADGLMGKQVKWRTNRNAFEAWRDGRTGVPFIDANMRELRATGYMSNRGRQNVASFLTKDLTLDWRLGAEVFEAELLDHEPTANYGNWNYAAGIGNDPREDRKFNIIKQAMDYDPNGEYVKLWCPELTHIPSPKCHCPWTLTPAEQQQYNCSIGEDYPNAIYVDGSWRTHQDRRPPQSSGGDSYYAKRSNVGRASNGRGGGRGGGGQQQQQQQDNNGGGKGNERRYKVRE
ncbi:unnamed protein product [Vitrella brassicaformis CCMP3155]|uniref:Cryptochrome DASH n=1 Tax=Vitrella brassicaformis (strain CCMP3155) TaxID=1169540 RepID=A0A0G4ERH9_VITBC|nr:unnamed protein product [Vitrella brassicaformis CCMP3155]|eukprot:CEM00012.1 unnamed protein product [Vitrella brassicaformis CCMP3155]